MGFEIQTARDEKGTIRRLRLQGGSGDSHQTITYYYDAQGRLRFAFAARAAVNGTRQEVRVYWDSEDELLYRDVRTLAGRGWAWGEIEEVREPDSWLRAGC